MTPTENKIQIIYENGQPYGIRDNGGYLLFFPTVRKYSGQEQRYINEIQDCIKLADIILKALLKAEMEIDKPCRFIKSCGLIEFECVGKEGCGDYESENDKPEILTETEYAEREQLFELQRNKTRWFSKQEFDRLKELNIKMYKSS